MQEHHHRTDKQINKELLSSIFATPKWWPIATLL